MFQQNHTTYNLERHGDAAKLITIQSSKAKLLTDIPFLDAEAEIPSEMAQRKPVIQHTSATHTAMMPLC